MLILLYKKVLYDVQYHPLLDIWHRDLAAGSPRQRVQLHHLWLGHRLWLNHSDHAHLSKQNWVWHISLLRGHERCCRPSGLAYLPRAC